MTVRLEVNMMGVSWSTSPFCNPGHSQILLWRYRMYTGAHKEGYSLLDLLRASEREIYGLHGFRDFHLGILGR